MTPKTLADRLRDLGACPEAVEWASQYDTDEAAWRECQRGDWMLWIAGRLAGKPGSDLRRPLVLAACGCARLTLPLFEATHHDDRRPRKAIETAERWARGEDGVTLDDVRQCGCAAAYPAYADDGAFASDAARFETIAECANIVRRHYQQPPVMP